MHEIDQSTGTASFISYQEPAWHKLGTVQQELISVDDCKTKGGLGFTVEKRPNSHHLPSGRIITSDDSFYSYRTDNEIILGNKLGKDYVVLQNWEALSIVDDIVKTGKATIETAGALYNGAKVFITLKLNDSFKLGNKDVVEQYLVIVTSHDARLSTTAFLTNVRVVCQNTLAAALREAKSEYKIRHTKNAVARTREAIQLLGIAIDANKNDQADYAKMKSIGITDKQLYKYVVKLFTDENTYEAFEDGDADAIGTRKLKTITSVMDYAHSGPGQKEAKGNQLNMWFAYNAVTGFLTKKEYADNDSRFNSLMMGSSSKLIRTASELAINPGSILN